MIIASSLLAVAGITASAYAFWVERKIAHDHTYKPMCDLSDKISCSKVARSPYAQLFQFSNSMWGILFYISILCCSLLDYSKLLLILSIMGVVVSCGLAYILYTKIKSFCLVCTSLYIINILLLITSYWYQ